MLDDVIGAEVANSVLPVTGSDSILVIRIHVNGSQMRGFNLWVTRDNVKKSVVINAILIAEELIKSYL